MAYRYAQIDENGEVKCDSWLSGPVNAQNMIAIEPSFLLDGKYYVNGEWENTEVQQIIAEPTQADRIEAGIDYLMMLAE